MLTNPARGVVAVVNTPDLHARREAPGVHWTQHAGEPARRESAIACIVGRRRTNAMRALPGIAAGRHRRGRDGAQARAGERGSDADAEDCGFHRCASLRVHVSEARPDVKNSNGSQKFPPSIPQLAPQLFLTKKAPVLLPTTF